MRQQLTPYQDNDSINHTDILLNSVYNLIESELAKFDIEIDMLRLLYKTIATSFLTPLSTGEGDVWGVIDDDGESDDDAAAQIGDDVEGGQSLMKITLSLKKILGFLSPLISGLFETPSEASWKLAQRNLRTLHQTTEALPSSLGKTLQIVSVTNRNVVMNG